ncbi:hypothetical protein Ae717Ps2_5794c [Pseudonocardia sp. Ae717_Ps2]|nr:hypothetical protein Ae717Ps2_5794c [Pseudonocardia sp. Ae717_Ps2]
MSMADRMVPLGYRTEAGHDPQVAAAAARVVLARAVDGADASMLIEALGLGEGVAVLAGRCVDRGWSDAGERGDGDPGW